MKKLAGGGIKRSNVDTVNIGSKVTILLRSTDGEEEELTFVLTENFGDSKVDSVSINSPMGRCVMGNNVGFEGHYTVRDCTFHVKILKIDN